MRHLIFSIFCVISFCAIAQNNDYYEKTVAKFREGNYSQALSLIEVFEHETGKTDNALKQKIRKCKEYSDKGEMAYSKQNWNEAARYYKALLDINPDDTSAQNDLNYCNEQIRKKQTDQSNNTSNSSKNAFRKIGNWFKPETNGYYIYLSSAFTKKNSLGMTISFNKSLFNIGLSFGIGDVSTPDKYLDDEEIKLLGIKDKAKSIIKHDYDGYSNLQSFQYETYDKNPFYLSLDPGLKFKYFSLNCGFGGGIIKEREISYNIRDNDTVNLEAENSIFTFMLRPCATIDIPISSGRSSLSVQIGSNIFPKYKHLNNVFVGIGFGLGDWIGK